MFTIGDVETGVVWLTPQDLGSIDNGAVSLLKVEATNPSGRQLFYRLKPGAYPGLPGVYNKLPQGLQLLPSGVIAGRVSFDTFALDGGTTTFDQVRATRLDVEPTTFDSVFRFTVNCYSQDGLISVFRDFEVRVNREFNEPYESLYMQAMPSQEDRDLLDSLLQNQDIIEPDFLFRPDDPYFGRAQRVTYVHAYGLRSATLEEYVQALQLNHYRKQLVLGDIRVAQARRNNTDEVVYEVVYSNVVDTGVNEQGESPPQTVPTAFPIANPDGPGTIDEVYPNSLIEMRDQVIDVVGQYAQVLPLWMTSKQENGRVLGFTRAFIIAYARPGKGEELAYNIRTEWGSRLNLINFQADRYTLDRQLSKNWVAFDDSTVAGQWEPPPSETTFDRFERPSNLRFIGPVDYATELSFADVNNQTLAYIASLGGIDGDIGSILNNRTLIFKNQYIWPDGITDTEAFTNWSSTYDQLSYDSTSLDPSTILTQQERLAIWRMNVVNGNYVSLSLVKEADPLDYVFVERGDVWKKTELYLPNQTARVWSLIPEPATEQTIFDDGSLRFIAPSDQYGLTDQYNKYLLFPKVNILYGPPEPPPPPPQLTGA